MRQALMRIPYPSTDVDVTVTEADSVQCLPTSCEESQHEEVKPKPDTKNIAMTTVSLKEKKDDVVIKTEENNLTQKNDDFSQQKIDAIGSNSNIVSLKNNGQKETVEEGRKGEVKKETVEDINEIVKDSKVAHIKETPNHVKQEAEAKVVEQKEGTTTEQNVTTCDTVKQEELGDSSKLEQDIQDITEQRDKKGENSRQKVGENISGLSEHIPMEQDGNNSDATTQEEGCVMETKTLKGLVKENETPTETSTMCVETSDALIKSDDLTKNTVDMLTDMVSMPPDDKLVDNVDTICSSSPGEAIVQADSTPKEKDGVHVQIYGLPKVDDALEQSDTIPKETSHMQIGTSDVVQDTDNVPTNDAEVMMETDSTLKQSIHEDSDNVLKLSSDTPQEIDDMHVKRIEMLIETEALAQAGEASSHVDCASLNASDAQKERDSNLPSSTDDIHREANEMLKVVNEASAMMDGMPTGMDYEQPDDDIPCSTSDALEYKDGEITTAKSGTLQWSGCTRVETIEDSQTETSDLHPVTSDTIIDMQRHTDEDNRTEAACTLQQPVEGKDVAAKDMEDTQELPDSMLSDQVRNWPEEVVDVPEQIYDTLQHMDDNTTSTWKLPEVMLGQSGDTVKQTGDMPLQEVDTPVDKVDTLVQEVDKSVQESTKQVGNKLPQGGGDTGEPLDAILEQPNGTSKQLDSMPEEVCSILCHQGDTMQYISEAPADTGDTLKQADPMVISEEEGTNEAHHTQVVDAESVKDDTQTMIEESKCDSRQSEVNGTEGCLKSNIQAEEVKLHYATETAQENNMEDHAGETQAVDDCNSLKEVYQAEEGSGIQTGKAILTVAESSMAEEVSLQAADNEGSVLVLSGVEEGKKSMPCEEGVGMQTHTAIPKEDTITEGYLVMIIPNENIGSPSHLLTDYVKESSALNEEVAMQIENSEEESNVIPKEATSTQVEDIGVAKEEFHQVDKKDSFHVEKEGEKESMATKKETDIGAENSKEIIRPVEVAVVESLDMTVKENLEMEINTLADLWTEEANKDSVIPEKDVADEHELEEDRMPEMSDGEDSQDTDSIVSTVSDTTVSLDQDDTEDMMDTQDPEWIMDDKGDPPSSCESTEGAQDDSDTVMSTVGGDSGPSTETFAAMPTSSSTQPEQETLPTSTCEKEATPVPEFQTDQQAMPAPVSDSTSIPESCEAEGREMIKSSEELEREQALCLAKLASDLLEHWSDLKEVYRIPKRSSPPPVSNCIVSLRVKSTSFTANNSLLSVKQIMPTNYFTLG